MSHPINDTWLEDLRDNLHDLEDQMEHKDWLSLKHEVEHLISSGEWEEAETLVGMAYSKRTPDDYTNGLIFGNLNHQKGSR